MTVNEEIATLDVGILNSLAMEFCNIDVKDALLISDDGTFVRVNVRSDDIVVVVVVGAAVVAGAEVGGAVDGRGVAGAIVAGAPDPPDPAGT
jgi:hypothetical protein